MAQGASERGLPDAAEDVWLACHDLWVQPVEWWTAWWDACVLPASGHRTLHAPAPAARHLRAVPEPDADIEHHLFA